MAVTDSQDFGFHITIMIQAMQAAGELQSFQTLDEVFRWALARTPRFLPADVIVQDEYTHDVLFQGSDGSYLAFDTT